MNEEEWRAQREQELKKSSTDSNQSEENRMAAERQLDTLLTSLLTPEAKTRLANIRLVNQEKYLQVAQALLSLAKQGRIQGKITEDQVKQLLTQISTKKRDITITRK